MANGSFKFILAAGAVFVGANLIAQGQPSTPRDIEQTRKESSEFARPQYQQTVRQPAGSRAKDLVWRGQQSGTWNESEASGGETDQCKNCGSGGFAFYKAAVFGDDYRQLRDSFLSDAEEHASTGTLMIVCPGLVPGDYKTSTGNYVAESVVFGASHGILSFDERRTIAGNLFGNSLERVEKSLKLPKSDPLRSRKIREQFIAEVNSVMSIPGNRVLAEKEIKAKFLEILKKCGIFVVVKGEGIEQVWIDDFINESYAFDELAQSRDRVYLKTTSFKKVSPKLVTLKVSDKKSLYNSQATLIAFHSDIASRRKVRSVGRFMPLDPGHPLYRYSNLLGHNVDSKGQSSGGCLYNTKHECIALHLGGDSIDGGDYDGLDRANFALLVTREIIDTIGKFKQ
jgi:hypothetical protein